jgi:hypothetical protein
MSSASRLSKFSELGDDVAMFIFGHLAVHELGPVAECDGRALQVLQEKHRRVVYLVLKEEFCFRRDEWFEADYEPGCPISPRIERMMTYPHRRSYPYKRSWSKEYAKDVYSILMSEM